MAATVDPTFNTNFDSGYVKFGAAHSATDNFATIQALAHNFGADYKACDTTSKLEYVASYG